MLRLFHRLVPVSALALFALALLATPARASVFSARVLLVPDTGLGMASEYAGVAPKWIQAETALAVSTETASPANELNLVWTFWGHTRPAAGALPSGPAARVRLVLQAPRSLPSIRSSILVRSADTWSKPLAGPTVSLPAGRPTELLLPLPALPAGGETLEALRVHLSADEDFSDLTVTAWALGEQEAISLQPPADSPANRAAPTLAVSGLTSPGAPVSVAVLDAGERVLATLRATADASGRFALALDRAKLPVGPLRLRASVKLPDGSVATALDVPLYLFPLLRPGATLPMVRREGRELTVDGKPWGFAGLNYTRFNLGYTIRTDFREAAEDLRTYASWGVNVLRIPLNLASIQPAPGVFPDDARYAEILRAHRLDPEFFNLLDSFIGWAGHHGIRLVLEWHEVPNDPYRYFIGGNEQLRGTGEPGGGIAWLSNPTGTERAEWGDHRIVRAIADTNRWLARRYRGNGNLLGFEVPYNEPHSRADSSEMAWRAITAATLRPIVAEDPERLAFGMSIAWGHGNVLPSNTWLPPEDLAGFAPHYYLGNGPVAIRPDAKSRPEPWLARDVAATFEHSFAAVALPHSASPVPVWNGESGEHGFESLFPDLAQLQSAPWMIETQLAQAYGAGMAGSLGWTLTGHETIYAPLRPVLEKHYRRYAPVFAAGPVDYSRAKILFVQNPGAVPVQNGLNHACVPFARLALDLHLLPVHYMSDAQLLANGLVQISAGLEQVESVASGLGYRAVVVDSRNLDQRALDLVRAAGLPLLVVDDAASLTPDRLAAFLGSAGIAVDRRTPADFQLIPGRAHLVVYRRSGHDRGPVRVYPSLYYTGDRSLVDEAGRVVFTGSAERLAADGIPVGLAKWTSAIFRITP